jgi:hypothetical protein
MSIKIKYKRTYNNKFIGFELKKAHPSDSGFDLYADISHDIPIPPGVFRL